MTAMLAALLDTTYRAVRPALFRLNAEEAHELTLGVLRLARLGSGGVRIARRLLGADDPRLAVDAFGLRFPNALGLAAGMDKNAIALHGWAALGFGHVEIGTVTPLPQPGNPRPRIFRLPWDQALINRMGFPNQGAGTVSRHLGRWARDLPMIVGANIGKGRDTPLERAPDDYAAVARLVAPHADYLAINISSPNTPGLRQLQAPAQVEAILAQVRPTTPKPILVKLAPDLELGAFPEIVAAARAGGAIGVIATNTTIGRDGLKTSGSVVQETGGLSGVPLRPLAQRAVRLVADLARPDLAVIGVGGIRTPADVRERLDAGAQLVQIYTGLVYEGPGLAARLLHAGR